MIAGACAFEYEFEPAVWWMNTPLADDVLSVAQRTSFSLAPHCLRVTIFDRRSFAEICASRAGPVAECALTPPADFATCASAFVTAVDT